MKRQRDRYLALLDLAIDPAERRQLAALIALVGIPPDLCYLFDGLNRTEQILTHNRAEFDQLLGAVRSDETTDDWLARIQLAGQLAPGLVDGDDDPLSQKMGRKSARERHPLHNYCLGICPHWANLFCEVPTQRNPAHWAIYQNLQARVSLYVLAAHVLTRGDDFLECYSEGKGLSLEGSGSEGDLPVGRISAASRSLRRLSDPDMAGYVELFKGDAETLSDLCDKAETSLSSRDGPGNGLEKETHKLLWVTLGDLRRLDELVLGDPQAGVRRALSFRASRRHQWPDGYVRLTHGQFAIAVEKSGDGGTLLRLFRDPGGKAAGDTEGPEPGPPRVDCAEQIGISIIEHDGDVPELAGPRRLQSERQARLITRGSTAPNLGRASLSGWQTSQLLQGLEKVESPTLRSFLICQLAIGRDLAGSVLPILAAMPKDPPKIAFLLGAQPSWLLQIAPPAWENKPWASVERPTSCFIRLPDLLGFAKCLGQPPPTSVTWGADTAREALEWLRQQLWDPSVTLGALGGFLIRRLLEETRGDVGLGYFLAGALLGHAVSAAHYTAWSETAAIDIYRRVFGVRQGGEPEAHASEPSRVIGARRVPTLEGVRKLVQALANQVRASTGVARRNALTAYTQLGFNIATAGRAFEMRLIGDFVRSLDLLVLAEKGGAYNNRVVTMPPRFKAQFAIYLNELASWGYPTDGPHGLFCCWGQGTKPEGPFSPQRFGELAQAEGFDLELYSIRRFARSELLARDVDPEDIDALMGHWFHLLSPHDMLSTYPVRRLRSLADGPIESLLADVDFGPLT